MANIILGGALLLPYLIGLWIAEKLRITGWVTGCVILFVMVVWNWMIVFGVGWIIYRIGKICVSWLM